MYTDDILYSFMFFRFYFLIMAVIMYMPINENLYQVLLKMDIKDGEYLFKSGGQKARLADRPWGKDYPTHHFKEITRKLGLSEKYSLHSCWRLS